jgi:hypothetical protein
MSLNQVAVEWQFWTFSTGLLTPATSDFFQYTLCTFSYTQSPLLGSCPQRTNSHDVEHCKCQLEILGISFEFYRHGMKVITGCFHPCFRVNKISKGCNLS